MTGTMINIFIHVDGETCGSHEDFINKLTKRGGINVVEGLPGNRDWTLVFCPIVSRFKSDTDSALTTAAELGYENVILVAMHHTRNKNYILPSKGAQTDPRVLLMVHCLFFEQKGLLACSQNKNAVNMVREELGLTGTTCCIL